MIPAAFWEGLGVGLGVSVALAVTARWLLERWARRERPAVPAGGAASVANAVPSSRDPVAPVAAPLVAAPVAALSHDTESTTPAPVLRPTDDYGAIPTNGGQVRISQRVLFHIAAQGRIGPDEVAPRLLSQAGIGEALGVSQGALTGVLRRLVAAGVLEEKRQHVRGVDRRVKVYRLTTSGQQLYRELRHGVAPKPARAAPPLQTRPAPLDRGADPVVGRRGTG